MKKGGKKQGEIRQLFHPAKKFSVNKNHLEKN